MYIEIRVQWTINLGSSHMHVHAVTRVPRYTKHISVCQYIRTSSLRKPYIPTMAGTCTKKYQ